jgi:hypothetical protein
MAGDEHTLLVNQRRHRPAKFDDRGGDFGFVGLGMGPSIVGVGD